MNEKHCMRNKGSQSLILDTSTVVSQFRDIMRRLPMYDEIDEYLIVSGIFDYIADYDYAGGNMLEFASSLQEGFANRYEEDAIASFGLAVVQLGTELYTYLVQLKAYDGNGSFWYGFRGFCLNDIVLRRLTEADLTN